MKIETSNYNIFLTNDDFSSFKNNIKNVYNGSKIFIVTQKNIYHLYHEKIKVALDEFEIKFVFCKTKDFKNYKKTIDILLKNKIQKHHLLVSLGGGVVGDLTGFIASTIFRGIKYVQIPTTLLSQIDSSIGAKVAIDLKKGKNLVGNFYNPALVLIDLKFLETLSKKEYNSGLGEAIKMAILFDKKLYEEIKRTIFLNINQIRKIIEIKLAVVKKDPFDENFRKTLNFGHTFGHIIEKRGKYKKYLHGIAISYGMLIALKIGNKLSLTDKNLYNDLYHLLILKGLISPNNNLLEYDKFKKDLIYDKKITDKGIDFIFLKKIGVPLIKNIRIEKLWNKLKYYHQQFLEKLK